MIFNKTLREAYRNYEIPPEKLTADQEDARSGQQRLEFYKHKEVAGDIVIHCDDENEWYYAEKAGKRIAAGSSYKNLLMKLIEIVKDERKDQYYLKGDFKDV